MRPPRNRQRPKGNIVSQRPSTRVPYSPDVQMDMAGSEQLQAPHASGDGGQAPGYVVTTFPALPVNAVNFMTQTGSHPDDTGWQLTLAPYSASSTFFNVPLTRTAILRSWQLIIVPLTGEAGDANQIFGDDGGSNFRFVLDFLVNGNPQPGQSGIVVFAGAFGDVFGETYILANPGDTIEARITANVGGSTWDQALFALQGDLLMNRGRPMEFEPSSIDVVPVHDIGV